MEDKLSLLKEHAEVLGKKLDEVSSVIKKIEEILCMSRVFLEYDFAPIDTELYRFELFWKRDDLNGGPLYKLMARITDHTYRDTCGSAVIYKQLSQTKLKYRLALNEFIEDIIDEITNFIVQQN